MAERDDQDRPRRPHREQERDDRTGRSAAAARIAQQATWVDLQVRQAMERGEFDDLPGTGKPIEDLGVEHDPDWWVKKLIERENIAILPPALGGPPPPPPPRPPPPRAPPPRPPPRRCPGPDRGLSPLRRRPVRPRR